MSTQSPQVAPEFISTLQNNIEETLIAYLHATHAPEAVLDLVRNFHVLSVYMENPQSNWVGIEDTTISTINLIAECGGVFHSEDGVTLPRKSVFNKSNHTLVIEQK